MSERIPVEITGTKTTAFTVDPADFRGMTHQAVTDHILKLAGEIDPGVNFFPEEAGQAAEDILYGRSAAR